MSDSLATVKIRTRIRLCAGSTNGCPTHPPPRLTYATSAPRAGRLRPAGGRAPSPPRRRGWEKRGWSGVEAGARAGCSQARSTTRRTWKPGCGAAGTGRGESAWPGPGPQVLRGMRWRVGGVAGLSRAPRARGRAPPHPPPRCLEERPRPRRSRPCSSPPPRFSPPAFEAALGVPASTSPRPGVPPGVPSPPAFESRPLHPRGAVTRRSCWPSGGAGSCGPAGGRRASGRRRARR